MFEGFSLDFVRVIDATLRVRHGGEGPPLLLLHDHAIASGHHMAEEAPEEVAQALRQFFTGR